MILFDHFKKFFMRLVNKDSKALFYSTLKSQINILDIGCGNDSVKNIKSYFPDSNYTGVDIHDFNLSNDAKKLMQNYFIFNSNKFVSGIESINKRYDLILSYHNIEHCEKPYDVLHAMMKKLKKNGHICLRFPNSNSVNFPSRKGTLNYYDDQTHQSTPPDFQKICTILSQYNVRFIIKKKSYKPFFQFLIGFILEPISSILKRKMPFTWEYYGFESVIYAEKK